MATFVFCAIFVRMFFLQVFDAPSLQLKALEQWTRTLPLTAKRGRILDSNGNALAISTTSYDVYVRAKEVDDANKVSAYLSSVLNLSFDKVFEKASNVLVSEAIVKLQVDESTALKIVKSGLRGVYVAENIKREYPFGKTLCQTLGFLTADSVGQSGVENRYNSVLSGTDGKFLTQSDVRGVKIDDSLNYYIDSIDGLNVKLNIDINIQLAVERTLMQIVADHNPKNASIVVMDPSTSKILAIGITPGFDLNSPPRDDVKTLLSQSKNICVSDVYEPGSTFKILTLVAALSEGLTNEHEHFFCPGYRIVDGQKIKCWKTHGHGDQTLLEAVQNSCNCCFMDLGLRLKKQKLYQYLKMFGIGSATGVDISGESAGILLNQNFVQNVDLARIAFGQTVAVNQLQLLNSFCSVINGGTLHTPQLLNAFLDGENEVFCNSPIVANQTVNSTVSKTLCALLEGALSKTGEMTFVPGYHIAGKTGTAQKYGEDGKISQGKYVSSFFGFLNTPTPQYAMLVCVDEPSSGQYYGSVVAKPYAKNIFEQIFALKNIPPATNVTSEEFVCVPNFVGLSISQAIAQLNKLGVNYEVDGEGTKVVSQFPFASSKVSKSSTFVVSTN